MVMCTHLHVDHVGWNTKLDNGRWVPTFPNAKYVWSKIDFDHFSALDRDPEKPAIGGAMRDSVYPIVEAGLAQMVDGTETIEEHLSLTPAPGHSPGHVLINLSSQGKPGLLLGRHHSPRDPGLSSGVEQLRLRGPAEGASVAAHDAGEMRRLGRAPAAAALRRAAHLPHRREGRRLHAAVSEASEIAADHVNCSTSGCPAAEAA